MMIKVLRVFIIFFLIIHQNGAKPNKIPVYEDSDVSEELMIQGTKTPLRVLTVFSTGCGVCLEGFVCRKARCRKIHTKQEQVS